MMVFASTHFAGVAGPGNTPPQVSAETLPVTAGDDQARIVAAVKRAEPSVVAIDVTVNGKESVPTDPFSQFFGQGGGGTKRCPTTSKPRVRASSTRTTG